MELAKQFSNCEKVTEQREIVTYKGEIHGKNVCVTSTGIGCPSAAIVVEELAIVYPSQNLRLTPALKKLFEVKEEVYDTNQEMLIPFLLYMKYNVPLVKISF